MDVTLALNIMNCFVNAFFSVVVVWYQTRFYHKSRIRVLAVYLPTNHSLSNASIPPLETYKAVITLQTRELSYNINIENVTKEQLYR